MRKVKRALLLVISVCTLMNMSVLAGDTPRMTFTNKKTEMPDLYITKTVRAEDAAPEDAEFTFEVKVNGQPYADKEYEIYTEGSQEIKKEKTNANGELVLKDKQKARFVYVGTGKTYEVTETNAPEGFKQIIPAEGTAIAGTMVPDGATAAFTNEYIDPKSQTEYTKLKISKRITVPSGYQMQNAAFEFQVTIDDQLYANQEYEKYEWNTDRKTETGRTDENGIFSLNGGEYALFPDIETGVSYHVKEVGKEGWWSVNGKTEIKDITQSNLTSVEFNNTQTSFIVTKKMDDGTKPEETFTFQLTDENRMIWENASYYLYNLRGELIDNEIKKTDANGYFYLKPGEAAVFTGIPAGTGYNVKELPLRGYSQTVPAESTGYTDKKVTGSIEELPFINHEENTSGVLMVTKSVKSDGTETPIETPEFLFQIQKVTKITDENGNETEKLMPVGGVGYEKKEGTGNKLEMTDEEGRFCLKAGETAQFTTLRSGEYQIEEITDEIKRNYTIDETKQRKTLKLSDENGVYFEFQNKFQMHKLDVRFQKESNDDGTKIQGAVFRLYKDQDLTDEYIPEGEEDFQGFVSGEDGTFVISELPIGTYFLKEISAPEEYGLSHKTHKLEIIREGDSYIAVIDGIKASAKENAAFPLNQGEIQYDQGNVILENDQAEYILKDRRKRDDCQIRIVKYRNTSMKDPLSGVTFKIKGENGFEAEKMTDHNGELIFDQLEEGTYQIIETETRSGLTMLSKPIEITLPYSMSTEEAADKKADTSKAEFVSTDDTWYFYHIGYNINNSPVLTLPMTGGTYSFAVLGFFVLLIGVFTRKKEKNDE